MATKEQKCKIKDAAKDLELTANDIIALVKEYTGAEKKPAASITASEMNIVLEHFSQKNQVESFDAYFATAEDKPRKNEPAKDKAEKTGKQKRRISRIRRRKRRISRIRRRKRRISRIRRRKRLTSPKSPKIRQLRRLTRKSPLRIRRKRLRRLR